MFKEFSEYLFRTHLPGVHTGMTWNKRLFSWRSAMGICTWCWGSLHFAPCLVYRPLVPPKPLGCERIPSLQTVHLWGLWFKQPFLFLLLLRCQRMCNWLPPLRPQLCVCQLAGELQVWVPEWLRVCRWPAHLHLWVPTRAPGCTAVCTVALQKTCCMVF